MQGSRLRADLTISRYMPARRTEALFLVQDPDDPRAWNPDRTPAHWGDPLESSELIGSPAPLTPLMVWQGPTSKIFVSQHAV